LEAICESAAAEGAFDPSGALVPVGVVCGLVTGADEGGDIC